ncbi:diphthine--ammonia ligase [Pontibacter qinzhouensis]|uniref:Diphthine--ammonia ligase n=1 Tax=Pontibacter qinzhouensis TaxID=2603253 RepID=A0A5C8KBW3_9BACT|nr:diphthine--ammonia ligase [Pontibacter qinzhouensis]TXK49652.1 diphthine--ammonia ligase [Pontibacter qinzhouensis]
MKSVFNWSGGKDSALCLYRVLQEATLPVDRLLTTLGHATQRVTMHGVRQELLLQQAQQLGLPLQQMLMPEDASMEAYNHLMQTTMHQLQNEGITHAVFGDINLQDLRVYREQQLAKVGLQAAFPLWGQPTDVLVREFIKLGFKAVVVSVNARLLSGSFAGRLLDEQFLADLPAGVDPCGENGEFHTFVFDGPLFQAPVPYTLGERVLRQYGVSEDEAANYDTGFWFQDLLPV